MARCSQHTPILGFFHACDVGPTVLDNCINFKQPLPKEVLYM